VQSANATNSDSDRAALDAEVQQRLSEITRISQQTTFNGRHVLDGTFGNAAFQIGANVGETISVNLSQGAGASQVGQIATSKTGDISSMFASPAGLTLAAGDLTVQVGSGTAVNVAAASYTDAASLIAAINTAAGSTIAAAGSGASANEIVFTNSSTTDTITFGGSAAAGLGMSTVAAATTGAATPGTASSTGLGAAITGAFNAITLQAGDLTLDGVDVTGTFKDSTELAARINALSSGLAGVDGSDHITLTNTSGTDIVVAGTVATRLGLSGTATNGGAALTASTTTASDVTANKNAVEASGADFTINGANVTGVFSDAASLKTLIDGASIAGLTTTVNAGELDFSNSGGSAVTFGGSVSFGLPASVAAQTAGSTTNGAATSTGVDAAVTAAASSALVLASGDLTIGGVDMVGSYASAQNLVDAINSKGIAGVSAYYDSDTKAVHLNSQSDLVVNGSKAGTGELGFSGAGSTAIATASNLAASDVKSVVGANDTISRIDAALGTISGMRSNLGAVQNRFESTIANLQTISQNLSSSRSQIQDADFAAETANMSSANILQQAGVSVLAQANASTQSVLKLLQ
jgi:flagellin